MGVYTDQEFEEQSADLTRRAGRNRGPSEAFRQYLAECRHRIELGLQEAEYPLMIYCNVRLMQGRI